MSAISRESLESELTLSKGTTTARASFSSCNQWEASKGTISGKPSSCCRAIAPYKLLGRLRKNQLHLEAAQDQRTNLRQRLAEPHGGGGEHDDNSSSHAVRTDSAAAIA